MSASIEREPEKCVLQNPIFTRLGTAMFRRAEGDGAPVMVVPFGDGLAALPLRSLQREFGIPDESADGRMLGLIAESLDFVAGLTIGDPLPAEVLDGHASWQPATRHQQIAMARLRLQLLAWIDPAAAAQEAAQPPSLSRFESDPALRGAVQRAFEEAAKTLELPGPQAVIDLVTDIADELSYIEALRDTFLRRVEAFVGRLDGFASGVVNADRQAALTRIRRLAHLALDQLASRFGEVDSQTGEVIATLRHAERHRSFIRSHRDWLYRSSRAWAPILAEWDGAMIGLDDATWTRLNRAYHFLAPRFMPVQEWFSSGAEPGLRKKNKPQNVMVW
jgi:hypothetical protein